MSEEKNELEKIDEELKLLGQPETKAPYVFGAIIGIVIFGIGIFSLALGLITNIGSGLVVGGGVALGLGLIIGLAMGIKAGKIEERNERIQELNKKRNELSSSQSTQDETDEETLLRLLSEGKITVDEYKKLSKK